MTDRERLVELIKSGGKLAVEENHKHIKEFVKNHGRYNSKTDDNVPFEEIVADYLLSNGVIVLPCRVGDTVFRIKALSRQEMYRRGLKPTEEIKRHKGQPLRFYNYVIYEIEKTTMKKSWYKDFGKTVFLTREEAEQALKEREHTYKRNN